MVGPIEYFVSHLVTISEELYRTLALPPGQVEGELEYRLRQKVALQTMLKEKMLELDRQNLQYQSLIRVESEQLALIERLSNSEGLMEEDAHHK